MQDRKGAGRAFMTGRCLTLPSAATSDPFCLSPPANLLMSSTSASNISRYVRTKIVRVHSSHVVLCGSVEKLALRVGCKKILSMSDVPQNAEWAAAYSVDEPHVLCVYSTRQPIVVAVCGSIVKLTPSHFFVSPVSLDTVGKARELVTRLSLPRESKSVCIFGRLG